MRTSQDTTNDLLAAILGTLLGVIITMAVIGAMR